MSKNPATNQATAHHCTCEGHIPEKRRARSHVDRKGSFSAYENTSMQCYSLCMQHKSQHKSPQDASQGVKMRPAVPALLLLLLTVAALSHAHTGTSALDVTYSFSNILPSLNRPANHSRIFYAVIFDAGSTGTRIHIYTFIHSDSEELLPVLDNEMFQSVKPGLSAYVDAPEMAGHTVRMLLKVAKKTVPRLEWKRTPVVLRATAGLRLLTAEKAQSLLDQVQRVFDESPFLIPDSGVGIMNGTDEGILAWVSVNFLTGHLYAGTKKTVGILDLGGGSTQITFLPNPRRTIKSAPADYVARFHIFNSTYELYSHSYLGNGLMAARLATLGALGAEGLEWRVFRSACLPKNFRDQWSFGGITYEVSGIPDGYTGYKFCYQEVLKVVRGIIHQPHELQDSSVFYAFSYYYDRAVDAGLIDGLQGGKVEVRDFKKRAKEVCNKLSVNRAVSPFLCMDMTYITCLLRDGFGFKDSTVLQLTKKVKNVEASWALGAVLDHFHLLQMYRGHHSALGAVH